MGLAMTDLAQLDKEMDLLGCDTIVLVIDLGGSGILTGMAQAVMDCNNSIPNEIVANNLSSFLEDTAR